MIFKTPPFGSQHVRCTLLNYRYTHAVSFTYHVVKSLWEQGLFHTHLLFSQLQDCSAGRSVAVCRMNGLKQIRKWSLMCMYMCYRGICVIESQGGKGTFSLDWFWWEWMWGSCPCLGWHPHSSSFRSQLCRSKDSLLKEVLGILSWESMAQGSGNSCSWCGESGLLVTDLA